MNLRRGKECEGECGRLAPQTQPRLFPQKSSRLFADKATRTHTNQGGNSRPLLCYSSREFKLGFPGIDATRNVWRDQDLRPFALLGDDHCRHQCGDAADADDVTKRCVGIFNGTVCRFTAKFFIFYFKNQTQNFTCNHVKQFQWKRAIK